MILSLAMMRATWSHGTLKTGKDYLRYFIIPLFAIYCIDTKIYIISNTIRNPNIVRVSFCIPNYSYIHMIEIQQSIEEKGIKAISFIFCLFLCIAYLLLNVSYQSSWISIVILLLCSNITCFQLPRFPNSVASLSYSNSGHILAVASSYTYQEQNEL